MSAFPQGDTKRSIRDGINDSIALKKANVSISMRGASSAATDTAQIILMDGRFASTTSTSSLRLPTTPLRFQV